MNNLVLAICCIFLCLAVTPGKAADSLSVVQWQKFENKPVIALVEAVEASTGQSWKVYTWRQNRVYNELLLTIPYSDKEDLQLRIQVERSLESPNIPHWQTDAIMNAMIASIEEVTPIPKVSEQYASDFQCLMKVVQHLYHNNPHYFQGLRVFSIETIQDPAMLDPAAMESVRQACENLSTDNIIERER